MSPSSGSPLMTSAPRSASTRPQVGPMTMCANSTSRTPSSGSTKSLRQAGEGHVAVDLLLGQRGDHQLARGEELRHVDSGRRSHALEHEHQVFSDHVAARTRRERAAAEPAHRAVEVAHAFLVGGERVGEAEAARVVQVRGFELVAYLRSYFFK